MQLETLTTVVQETTFRNEENGYTVLRVGTGRAQQTVVGLMPELSPGENVTFEGTWGEHPVYGKQFNARTCTITPPEGKAAIEKYLPDLKPDFANCKRIEVYDSEMNVFR